MTPTELEAIRKRANPYRIDGGSYVANPGLSPERDVRALLVYVDKLREVIAAADAWETADAAAHEENSYAPYDEKARAGRMWQRSARNQENFIAREAFRAARAKLEEP